MKQLLPFLFAALLALGSCGNAGVDPTPPGVINDDGSITFNELLILLNVKVSGDNYLAVESLDSVRLYLNNNYWGTVSTNSLDVSKLNTFTVDNKPVSKQKLNYLLRAQRNVIQPDFNTAGDFAKFLNRPTFNVEAGEYACFIESFQATMSDGTVKTFYPYIYKIFRIRTGERNAYLGEIQITLND